MYRVAIPGTYPKNIFNMKSLKFSIFALLLVLTTLTQAQLRTKVVSPIVPGTYLSNYNVFGNYPNTITGLGTADTLAVSDTIAYVVPIQTNYQYLPFLSFGWTKIGAGTATITASFYQGNSQYNFTPLKAGSANTTYTKTFTLSASGTNFVDFLADSVKVSGRYLKIQYTTSSTASVSGSVVTVLNTAIK